MAGLVYDLSVSSIRKIGVGNVHASDLGGNVNVLCTPSLVMDNVRIAFAYFVCNPSNILSVAVKLERSRINGSNRF
jgi:hypothetical protein